MLFKFTELSESENSKLGAEYRAWGKVFKSVKAECLHQLMMNSFQKYILWSGHVRGFPSNRIYTKLLTFLYSKIQSNTFISFSKQRSVEIFLRSLKCADVPVLKEFSILFGHTDADDGHSFILPEFIKISWSLLHEITGRFTLARFWKPVLSSQWNLCLMKKRLLPN